MDYTCIGFARSHGIFDGGGAALVMNALVAEMNGREWAVPPLPHEGANVNPLEQVLARAARAEQYSRDDDFAAYTVIGPGGVLKLAASHVKERFWAGADRRIILMPKAVLDTLVEEEVRSSLRSEGKQVEHVTTGDVLVAWIFKVRTLRILRPFMFSILRFCVDSLRNRAKTIYQDSLHQSCEFSRTSGI